MSSFTCSACGDPIVDEDPSADSSLGKQCPKCGSLARTFTLQGTGGIHLTGTAQTSLETYPDILLKTAQELFDQKQYGISVVVLHMACEVAAERALSTSFARKNLEYLEEAVFGFLNGYNLASDRNRKLYVALTGDPIHEQRFWQEFKESAERRNNVIHRGYIVGQDEAEKSLSAAKAFIAHMAVKR